jgi:hypothetical protein
MEETPQPVIYRGMSFADYLALPGVNQSRLKVLQYKSPAHYRAENAQNDTPALAIGRAIHSRLLEPATFDGLFTLSPFENFRTKAAQEWRDQKQAEGVTILAEDDLAMIEAVAENTAQDRLAAKLLDRADREVSILWTDPATGIKCKARLDLMSEELGIVADLKTCQSAEPLKFQRDAFAYGYHFQAAFYSRAFEAATGKAPKVFVYLAIEKSAPFPVVPYPVSPLMLAAGDLDVSLALAQLCECMATDKWPAYASQTLDLPGYAQSQYPGVYTPKEAGQCPI